MRRIIPLAPLVLATAFVAVLAFSCAKPSPAKKPVTIRWWHINSDQPSQRTLEAIAKDFMKEKPYADVRLVMLWNMEYKQKLALEFAAKDPPDIFHSWGGGGLAEQVEAGYLRDITEWVNSDRWHSKINPVALGLFSHKGRVYGFPQDLGAVGFWYNSELLSRAGYSRFPEDWDAFLKMLDDLKAAGVTPISLGIADRWTVMYYWVYLAMRIGGPEIFNDILQNRKSFEDPAMVEAARMMTSLTGKGYFPATFLGDDFAGQSRNMGDGNCALQLMGQWAVAVQAQSSERKEELSPLMRFAPFPRVKGGQGDIRDVMGGGNGFVIGANASDEAVELLEFFTREENLQRYFDSFPSIPTVSTVKIRNPGLVMVQDYLRDMENYCLYPDQLFPLSVGTAINEISARVMVGELTPERGCAELQKAWVASRQAEGKSAQ